MITASEFIQGLADCQDVALVGGKGSNLGRLVRAGFPVPGGFVIGTRAFEEARETAGGRMPEEIPAAIAEEIVAAYRALGGGAVAVRSSATAEDMAAASMAGQYETFLDVVGEEKLLEKVRHCWASLDSPRIRAYLAEHGIDQARVAMAVVVQKLVPSDVAGVLFTINPNASARVMQEMLIEASWGLGESVVGGRVQPDVLRIDSQTGKIIEAVIADKKVTLAAGAHAEKAVDESRRRIACLGENDVRQLWELGKLAATHFGVPQDIEWAIHAGKAYLLQSRPITTHHELLAREELLAAAQAELKTALAAGHGPWALHNLAETLAHPTPLTWSVIRQFMSGQGGYGELYRMAGFEPSAAVREQGFLDRIGGRIYMDAARAPEMFFADFPFAYDLAELKRNPEAGQLPPTLPKGSLGARRSAGKRLAGVTEKLRHLAGGFDRELRERHFPELAAYVSQSRALDLRKLTADELKGQWEAHEKRILQQFAPLSLLPSLICGMALAELRAFLAEHLWQEDPDALAQLLSSGGIANRTVMADAELYEVATGERTIDAWLNEHGHRGPGEFDLAAPRWREQPDELRQMAQRLVGGERPLERHRQTGAEVARRCAELRAKLTAPAAEFDRRLELVRRYVPFREDGKDFFMLGYELLRLVAVEAGRRLGIGQDVFQLTRDEMFAALRTGTIPGELITERLRLYRAESKLSLPSVIGPDDVHSLGAAPASRNTAGGQKAFSLSAGMARGRALILHSPTEAGNTPLEKGYILVCPSTDPSWTPLFVNAAGLILEVGGTLSHGAVVAREMGLPAVVVPDATRLFRNGDEIIVDGTSGWAGTPAEQAAPAAGVDPDDTRIAFHRVPPPAGPKDRAAGRLRNALAGVWALFILAFFLLPPAWVSQPTLVFLDALVWPLVRIVGKPATVALVAAVIAVVTLLLQRFLTDNARLREAKRRAASLTKEADKLLAESPRRKALLALAAPVQVRTLMAALVPVGILLGPLVLPFAWFAARMEPSTWSAAPGTPVTIVAFIDDRATVASVELPAQAKLAHDTDKPALDVPQVRPVLEKLLAAYRQSPEAQGPKLEALVNMPADKAAADLQAYLNRGIPPQPVSWQVLPDPQFTGGLPVRVTAGGQSLTVPLVFGDPPEPTVFTGDGPVRRIEVTYNRPNVEPVFCQPLAWVPGMNLGWIHLGWIWVYVLAYLPALFITRALLRVA